MSSKKEKRDKKEKEYKSNIFDFTLTPEDMAFIIEFENGEFLEVSSCMLEFYFLILCNEFNLAIHLLKQPYAEVLKNHLNELFMGDEKNILKDILNHTEITKECITLSLHKQLDGVAL